MPDSKSTPPETVAEPVGEDVVVLGPDKDSNSGDGLDGEIIDVEVFDGADVISADAEDEPGLISTATSDAVQSSSASSVPALHRSGMPETVDVLNVYLSRLKDVEILPIEEQAQLAEQYQLTGDQEAAARLVASNLRLVVKIAFQFRRQWADVMDLIAEGNLGLAEAMRKFDVSRSVPFPSYARFWIRARILAFIQENKHLVHAGSRAARKLFWRLERERRRLKQEGFDPSPKRLAEAIGVTVEDVNELAPILDARPVSLDSPIGGEDGRTRGESLSAPEAPSPEHQVGTGQVHGLVQDAFAQFRETLNERDQAIWDRRLQAVEPERLEDIGITYGVSKERVRQLEARIKEKLKVFLKQHLGEDIIVEALR